MVKNSTQNNNKYYIEIIRTPPVKKVTPTEKIRQELEESLTVGREVIKSIEVDRLVPKLKSLVTDEEIGIKEYEELHILFNKISFATGMLEQETKSLKRIIDDEKEHKKELQRILDELTR